MPDDRRDGHASRGDAPRRSRTSSPSRSSRRSGRSRTSSTSTARSFPSFSLVTARFKVGTDMETASARLSNKILGNMDRMPAGHARMPLVKVRSIDDVPILGLTLWSDDYDGYEPAPDRRRAEERDPVAWPTSRSVEIIGGRRRDGARRARPPADGRVQRHHAVGPAGAAACRTPTLPAGMFADGQRAVRGRDRHLPADRRTTCANLVVGVFGERPVTPRATWPRSPTAPPTSTATPSWAWAPRPRGPGSTRGYASGGEHSAVTISIAKRKGSDATRVADAVKDKVAALQGTADPGRRARHRSPATTARPPTTRPPT